MELVPFPKRWLLLSLFSVAVILGSCRTPATATNAAAPRPEPTPSARATCQTKQLLLAKGQFTSNLGNAGLQFSFENHARLSCTLFGYPTLQLLDAQHQPLLAQIKRSTGAYLYRTRNPQVISLRPGEKAYFVVAWGIVGCGDAPPTDTTPTSFLLITPPLNQTSFVVAFRICAFDNQVLVSPLEPSQILGVFIEGGSS